MAFVAPPKENLVPWNRWDRTAGEQAEQALGRGAARERDGELSSGSDRLIPLREELLGGCLKQIRLRVYDPNLGLRMNRRVLVYGRDRAPGGAEQRQFVIGDHVDGDAFHQAPHAALLNERVHEWGLG